MEQPKMHYWAEIGQQDGKYSAAIDYDRRQNGGVYVKGTVTAVGMKLWLPFAKALYTGLKASGLEPELVNGSPDRIGRRLTPEEERQVLEALHGK